MTDLDGMRVAITGGFGNLGMATARVLTQRGGRVALIARGGARDGPPDAAFAVTGIDLTDARAAQLALDQIAAHFGGVDALVNAAGGFCWETIADGSADAWDDMFAANVSTALHASKAALAHFGAGGRIVNVGAAAALKAVAGMGAYAASKAALMRMTEALADELKDRGVTVNAVLPSIIDTPQNRADMPSADYARWVSAEDIAGVIAFLLSKDARCITGASLPVTGRL
ncbi:SDR family NAD(P)-dependent oxidoreductase [Caballeronia sp. Lep1P3]|uniref:SDR family NAD(P)-dependent oxidoreductase n=1 Tax=Caballeronia sp. Lep1P3 TaxID=2878150 RepID=UPI001FD5796A|nr:SDR family NAD(P)-dependent oxidoreductase [Caballeronia sp. Lep1P3]